MDDHPARSATTCATATLDEPCGERIKVILEGPADSLHCPAPSPPASDQTSERSSVAIREQRALRQAQR